MKDAEEFLVAREVPERPILSKYFDILLSNVQNPVNLSVGGLRPITKSANIHTSSYAIFQANNNKYLQIFMLMGF